jgi:large subunit ribosomal protein L5
MSTEKKVGTAKAKKATQVKKEPKIEKEVASVEASKIETTKKESQPKKTQTGAKKASDGSSAVQSKKPHLAPSVSKNYVARLKKRYEDEVCKALKDLYKYTTPMAIPRLVKVVINMGLGEATQDKTILDPAVEEMTIIAAQKAVKTFAKKSISNFHLREGMPIGVKVNLRGNRMYDFVDKLVTIALPRVRDFKGLSQSGFDGRGNFTVGLKEQLVFPEIDYDKVKKVRGMDITIVTTAKTDEEAYQLFKHLGFPFKEK